MQFDMYGSSTPTFSSFSVFRGTIPRFVNNYSGFGATVQNGGWCKNSVKLEQRRKEEEGGAKMVQRG